MPQDRLRDILREFARFSPRSDGPTSRMTEAFNLLRALSLDPNSVAAWGSCWFWLEVLDASVVLFWFWVGCLCRLPLLGFWGWLLIACGWGCAVLACRMFDNELKSACSVHVVLHSAFLSLSVVVCLCHVCEYRFGLKLWARVVTLAVIHATWCKITGLATWTSFFSHH